MIFAAADDPAVVIIKLADRIHNMQTLGAFKGRRDKILRKARETMDIYAPIASNMGMFKFFFILQNLCFSYIYPCRYKVIKHRYEKILNRDKKMVERIIREINEKLEEKYIVARVEQRDRSFWNIYLRMLAQLDKEFNKKGRKEKKKYFNTATKTMTLRIITDSEDFDEERFDIYVNGECRYRDVDSSLAYSILGQFGPNDDVEVKRVGEDDFEDYSGSDY